MTNSNTEFRALRICLRLLYQLSIQNYICEVKTVLIMQYGSLSPTALSINDLFKIESSFCKDILYLILVPNPPCLACAILDLEYKYYDMVLNSIN